MSSFSDIANTVGTSSSWAVNRKSNATNKNSENGLPKTKEELRLLRLQALEGQRHQQRSPSSASSSSVTTIGEDCVSDENNNSNAIIDLANDDEGEKSNSNNKTNDDQNEIKSSSSSTTTLDDDDYQRMLSTAVAASSNSTMTSRQRGGRNNTTEVISLLDDEEEEDDNDKKQGSSAVLGGSRGHVRDHDVSGASKVSRKRSHNQTIVLDLSNDDSGRNTDVAKRSTKKINSSGSNFSRSIGNRDQSTNITSAVFSSSFASSNRVNAGVGTPLSFQVGTWNVWFGPQGNGQPHPVIRMRSLCKELYRYAEQQQQREISPSSHLPPPSHESLKFIGCQEVITELESPLKVSLESRGYRLIRQPLRTAPYGCAIALHNTCQLLESNFIGYEDTCMGRGFLYVKATLPSSSSTTANGASTSSSSKKVLFCTTHLESFAGPHYNGSAQRPIQLRQMERFCNEALDGGEVDVAIMTGDMNWDDEKVGKSSKRTLDDPPMLSVLVNKDWNDVWLEGQRGGESTHKTLSSSSSSSSKKKKGTKTQAAVDVGFTYDAKLNPMLGGSLRRRFDRCLVRSSTKLLSNCTKLLGQHAIGDMTWEKYNSYTHQSAEKPLAPSDHFGLVTNLTLTN